MAIAQSKITAQCQISVPAEVRKKLGVGPGSILEWEDFDDGVIVRRGGSYTLDEVRDALFPEGRPERKRSSTKEGIRKAVRGRHARR